MSVGCKQALDAEVTARRKQAVRFAQSVGDGRKGVRRIILCEPDDPVVAHPSSLPDLYGVWAIHVFDVPVDMSAFLIEIALDCVGELRVRQPMC